MMEKLESFKTFSWILKITKVLKIIIHVFLLIIF